MLFIKTSASKPLFSKKPLPLSSISSASPVVKDTSVVPAAVDAYAAQEPKISISTSPDSLGLHLVSIAVAQRENPIVGHVFSGWQTMISAASLSENREFNKSAQAMFPGYSLEMRKMFFSPPTPESWFRLPRVRLAAQTFMAEGNGPLLPLAKSAQLTLLGTENQYSVTSSSAHARAFNVLKNRYGSSFVFHGSPRENWQQILTQGLEPKSGTVMQANGALKGSGVYVATHSFLSKGFTDKDGQTAIMGVAEIIHHPSVGGHGQAYVVPEKVFVLLRFVAIYPNQAAIPDIRAADLPKPSTFGAL